MSAPSVGLTATGRSLPVKNASTKAYLALDWECDIGSIMVLPLEEN